MLCKCDRYLNIYKYLCSRPIPVPSLPVHHSRKHFSNLNKNKLKFSDTLETGPVGNLLFRQDIDKWIIIEKDRENKESLVTIHNRTNLNDQHVEWSTPQQIG
jgi:hypothetical protein